MLLRFDGEFTREEFRPAPDQDRLTVENGFEVSLTSLQPITDWLIFTGIGSWRRDTPLDLDHRAMGQAGLALQVAPSGRIEFMIGPLVGVGSQNDASAATSGRILNLGAIQALTWRTTNTFVVQNYLTAHQDLENSDDFAVSLSVSGTARIAGHVGLKVYYQLRHDGIRPDGADARRHKLGFGLNVSAGDQ